MDPVGAAPPATATPATAAPGAAAPATRGPGVGDPGACGDPHDRLGRLSRAIAELAGAREVSDVRAVLLSHAAAALDAVVVSLSLLSDDGTTLELAGITGATAATRSTWASYPVSADVPASEAVRTRAPVHCATAAEFERRYPVFPRA